MNREYRVIWSKALCSWVVVCELTRRSGKSGGSIVRKLRRSGLVTAAGALLATSALADPAATALPNGGQVAAGQAAISQSGNTLTIRHSRHRLAHLEPQSGTRSGDRQRQRRHPRRYALLDHGELFF
jgi:hypothetical protein